jgi:hypothetical protein
MSPNCLGGMCNLIGHRSSYDSASDAYSADERYVGDARYWVACHTTAAAKNYMFMALQEAMSSK